MTTQTLEMDVQVEAAPAIVPAAAPEVARPATPAEDKSVRNLIVGTVLTALFVGAMHALPYAIEFGGRAALGF